MAQPTGDLGRFEGASSGGAAAVDVQDIGRDLGGLDRRDADEVDAQFRPL